MGILDLINKAREEFNLDAKLLVLSERVYFDEKPKLQNAYLFSQTKDNQDSLFKAAHTMAIAGFAHDFYIINGIEKNGFPGYEKWNNELADYIGKESIHAIPTNSPDSINTQSESAALMSFSKKSNLKDWYIVAAPFHQLRAFMTAASESITHGHATSIYNYVGAELPWDETVFHSQGILEDTRANLIFHEMKRIKEYANIRPVEELLDYMDLRKA